MTDYKVIFHIDELNKWNMVLANVTNLLEGVTATNETIEVEVLANSEAIEYYSKNNNTDLKMVDLNKKGVKFLACNNSLKGYNLKPDNIIDIVNIVPVGVLELIKKQKDGYAYLKP
jgi:intracellular sulfur oxidation DsrE/DsrF family protein